MINQVWKKEYRLKLGTTEEVLLKLDRLQPSHLLVTHFKVPAS
jgi:hypothetical protein